jgi:predicted  nucleic acid-binding Zn-ribbon protein
MASSSWTTRDGELAALLQLAQIDARLRQAEQSSLDIARQLNQQRLGIETLSRFVSNDRDELARHERRDEEAARLERFIHAREKQLAQLSELFGADRLRAEPLLERVRATADAARAEREQLLRRLDRPLISRYEELQQRGATPFIVPMRDGCCAGCAAALATALVDVLRRPKVVAPCPRCERILYGRGLDA